MARFDADPDVQAILGYTNGQPARPSLEERSVH